MSAADSYKVVLVGDLDIGKTTLFNRFKTGEFVEVGDERQTRQQAEHHKTWEYEGETFSVSLNDTRGSIIEGRRTVSVYTKRRTALFRE